MSESDETCQLFEFLMRTSKGTQLFPFILPSADADRVSDLFSRPHDLENGWFVEFGTVEKRVVNLNLKFVVACSRFDITGRAADQIPQSEQQPEGAPAIAATSPFDDTMHAADLVLFIDGLDEPLCCDDIDPSCIEYAAILLREEPSTHHISVPDEENIRTRFIPARRIILMESIEYHRNSNHDA